MSFAQYLWDSFSDLVDTQGGWEDSDASEVEKKGSRPTSSLPFADTQHTPEPSFLPGRAHAGTSSATIEDTERKGAEAKEPTTEEVSDLKPSDDVDQDDRPQQEGSRIPMMKNHQNINSHPVYQDLIGQSQRLQEENIRHLRWQDGASMAIKKLEEEKESRKREARATKKVAATAKKAMQREIDELQHQAQESELEKGRVFQENARATEAYERCLQEVEKGLKAEKEAAERAAAAAERQIKEVQARHDEQMRVADSEIGELKAVQSSSTASHRELAQAKKERGEHLAAKEREIGRLQTRIGDRDFVIRCARADAVHDRQAKRQITWEKNDLVHTNVALEGQVKKLQEEKESLELKKEHTESMVSGAEGRAQGLRSLLRATENRADNWEKMCKKAEENARNEILSAYEFVPAQVSEDDQRITRTSDEVEESRALVKQLRNENSELRRTIGSFEAVVAKWERTWQESMESHKTWEENVVHWKEDIRGQYEKEKRQVIAAERAKGLLSKSPGAMEKEIRRQCETEKQSALAGEREACRVQWENQKCSLQGQFAAKLKSHTDGELQKLRRRDCFEKKHQLKVRKRQVRWTFGKAVSHAVEVEHSLILKKFRDESQRQLSDYKTRFESERANSQAQSGGQNIISGLDQVLLNEEIQKRDKYLEQHKSRLTEAYAAKRELEGKLKTATEENRRLSREVIAFGSERAMAKQTRSEAQVTLMAREYARAVTLLTEITVLGLDEKHFKLLNDLVHANKVVRDIRTTIEEGGVVDHIYMLNLLDRICNSSDDFDDLDPLERPALHAQLLGTYAIIGGLMRILSGERGETIEQDMIETIYEDSVKGKGKEKEKQGAIIGPGVASALSFGANREESGAPVSQSNGYSNASIPGSTQHPNENPNSSTPKPVSAESQDGSTSMDSATAHALLDRSDMNGGAPDPFDLDSVDWSDPAWLNFNL